MRNSFCGETMSTLDARTKASEEAERRKRKTYLQDLNRGEYFVLVISGKDAKKRAAADIFYLKQCNHKRRRYVVYVIKICGIRGKPEKLRLERIKEQILVFDGTERVQLIDRIRKSDD